MTVERKLIFGLDDIKTISFECTECHVKVSVPADKFSKVPSACHSCRVSWRPQDSRDTAPPGNAFDLLAYSLESLLHLLNQGAFPKFRILFEFNDPR